MSNANLNRKLRSLEKRKAMLDALVAFLKSHPKVAPECELHPFAYRTGLMFVDTALIRPLWDRKQNRVILRLEKYTEEISAEADYDPFDASNRTLEADVTNMPEDEILAIVEKVHRELYPEWYEENEDDEES